jgi:hypothetical protein
LISRAWQCTMEGERGYFFYKLIMGGGVGWNPLACNRPHSKDQTKGALWVFLFYSFFDCWGGGVHWVFLEMFFSLWKGVIFFTNSLWDGDRVHRGKGCTEGKGAPWFFFFFFWLLRGRGVEVNVFFCLHLTCWRRKGKGKGWFFLKFCFFIVEWLGTGGTWKGFFHKYVEGGWEGVYFLCCAKRENSTTKRLCRKGEFHNKAVVQKATRCQIEKYMKERRKNRELSLMSFLVSFCDLVLLSFCPHCCVQECFKASIFFFYDGLLTSACHENPEVVVLKLHFLSPRSLFVFSVWICLRFMIFFWIQRREEERVQLSSGNVVAN